MAPLALDIRSLPLLIRLCGTEPSAALRPSRASSLIASFDIRLSSATPWLGVSGYLISFRVIRGCLFKSSFQKEIHAIEIDYGMTEVQRVHPQNANDSRAALPQGETR